MKRFLVLLTLCAAPQLAFAQTTTAPVAAKAPQAPMPDAQELLDNLFAPYVAAKTFRGNMSLSIKDASSKIGVSALQLKTRYRFNANGDLQSEDTTAFFIGADSLKQKSELHFIHDGATNVGVLVDKKVWWQEDKDHLDSQPLFISALALFFDAVNEALEENDVTPVVSRGVEAGRPVFILKAKLNNDLRVVIDQQTRVLRSLELKDAFSIHCFDQIFDEPLTDASFQWAPSADFKQIEESESTALMPEFLKRLSRKPAAETSPTE